MHPITLQPQIQRYTPARPRRVAKGAAQPPRFQGFGPIGPNAISALITDTLGVWMPKMPFVRSKAQFFEDTFLEFVEDAAFYFTVPLASYYALAPVMSKWLGVPHKAIGTSLKAVNGPVSKALIAAKAGTLLGSVAIAGGFEYMIQFAKNVITAHKFKTKNFTAVAGLEPAQAELDRTQVDPVAKAKRRLNQVLLAVAGLLGVALWVPRVILQSPKAYPIASKLIKAFDFGRTPFDMSKPILSLLIGTGVISYLDAARGPLERKETAFRLSLVVPYLLFGKELVGNALGWWLENQVVGTGANRFRVKDKVPFLDKSLFQKDSFLNLSVVRSGILDDIIGHPTIPKPLKSVLTSKYYKLEIGKYIISAILVGVGVNLLSYHQTRERFKRDKAKYSQINREKPVLKQNGQSATAFAPQSFDAVMFSRRVPYFAYPPTPYQVAANPFRQ